jgi:hypothetical protein
LVDISVSIDSDDDSDDIQHPVDVTPKWGLKQQTKQAL